MMEPEPLDLTATWRRFKDRPFKITPRQQELIAKLIVKLGIEDEHQQFIYLTTLVGHPIESWEQLTTDDVGKAIYILKNRQAPTKTDAAEITKLFTVEEINNIFSKQKNKIDPISHYDQLTHGLATLLLNKKKRFNNAYKDYPITATMDYEYGWQESPLCENYRMYYIKFYELMMIDYDEMTYDEVIEILKPYAGGFYFEIHQTFNGYHVFVISCLANHQSPMTSIMMMQLKCDHYYGLFCYNNGFKIRLSKKVGRDETFVSRVVGRYGNEVLLDPECEKLLDVFLSFLKAESDK